MKEPLPADQVARKDFSLSFRGFDQQEVRAYLGQLASAIDAWQEEMQERIAVLESAPAELDEVALEAALGREATRVIHAAREAASEIRANAETSAAHLHTDSERRAAEIIEESRTRAAAMVEDAAAERDRVLAELDDQRHALLAELSQLSAARERLVASFEGVRRALDGAIGDVRDADAAATELVAAPERAPAVQLEVVEPQAIPVDEPPVEPVAMQPLARPTVLSARRLEHPEAGTPVAPPAEDRVERVRIIRPEPAAAPEPPREIVPEPEVAVEMAAPEVAAEEPAVAVTPEPPAPEDAPAVDGLFARLRADRAEKVASAEAVLASDRPTVPSVAPDVPAPAASALGPDLVVLASRDEAVADAERSLVRSLKRALSDEQNEALDALRQLRGEPTLGALLPEPAVHDARFGAVLKGAATTSAEAAGHRASGTAVAAELGRSLATDLRARIDRAIEEAGGDVETLAEALSSTYREWKTARVEPLARDVITAGFAAGAYAATDGPVRWVVDPAEGGCPDCDDNVLAGPTEKGTAFPTGQLHPPAHAGCRCLAVPAS